MNVISADIRASVVYVKTAHAIWTDLEHRFTRGNGPQVFNIKKEITSLTRGIMIVSTSFTKFCTLKDELTNFSPIPKCVCVCLTVDVGQIL